MNNTEKLMDIIQNNKLKTRYEINKELFIKNNIEIKEEFEDPLIFLYYSLFKIII